MSSGTELHSPERGSPMYQPNKCIICQKSKRCPVTSTANGQAKITEAALIRKDAVLEHLN